MTPKLCPHITQMLQDTIYPVCPDDTICSVRWHPPPLSPLCPVQLRVNTTTGPAALPPNTNWVRNEIYNFYCYTVIGTFKRQFTVVTGDVIIHVWRHVLTRLIDWQMIGCGQGGSCQILSKTSNSVQWVSLTASFQVCPQILCLQGCMVTMVVVIHGQVGSCEQRYYQRPAAVTNSVWWIC